MGKLKNKKLLIAGSIVIILIAVMILIFNLMNNKEVALNNKKLKHDTVDKLYEMVEVNDCADLNAKENKENNAILYLVFNQMKKDKILADEIPITRYFSSLDKVVGNKEMDLVIKNYYYDGYKYNLSGDTIVREKTSCNFLKYVSKLYGYTYNDEKMELHINLGYISNNKVYNLDGVEIGDYDKDKINTILEKGSMQVYSYDKKGSNYYLTGIKDK